MTRRRRGRRRSRLVAPAAALALLVAAPACAKGPTDDQRAVCDSLQRMLDRQAAGDGPGSIDALGPLQESILATSDPALKQAGTTFFDAISRPVDVGSLTAKQSSELGDQVLAQAGSGFADLVNACTSAGVEIRIDRQKLAQKPANAR